YRGRYPAWRVHRIPDRSPACRYGSYQVRRTHVNPLVLVVDDEPDVEVLFRRQFSLAGRYFGLMTVVLLAIQTLRGQAPQAVITNCCKNVVTISNDYRLGAHRGIVTLTLGLSSRRHDKKLLIVSRCQQLSGRSYRVSRSR